MKIWFENGITTNSAMYGTNATAGASENTHRSAAAGMMSSFWMNFTPSAISCAQPWNPPGLHRSEPRLHVGEHLVLGVAHPERRREEEDQHDERSSRRGSTSSSRTTG